MNESSNNNNNLVLNTLDDIPNPSTDAKEIVALVKKSGKVSGYKLSDGNIVTKDEGVSMAKDGKIRGVGVSNRNGSQYLKSIPDGTESNNLGNLPTVK